MNLSYVKTKAYEQRTMNNEPKNKANSKPIQTQFKPKTNPKQTQFKPNLVSPKPWRRRKQSQPVVSEVEPISNIYGFLLPQELHVEFMPVIIV